jgi:hypothetical protein
LKDEPTMLLGDLNAYESVELDRPMGKTPNLWPELFALLHDSGYSDLFRCSFPSACEWTHRQITCCDPLEESRTRIDQIWSNAHLLDLCESPPSVKHSFCFDRASGPPLDPDPSLYILHHKMVHTVVSCPATSACSALIGVPPPESFTFRPSYNSLSAEDRAALLELIWNDPGVTDRIPALLGSARCYDGATPALLHCDGSLTGWTCGPVSHGSPADEACAFLDICTYKHTHILHTHIHTHTHTHTHTHSLSLSLSL